MAFWSHTIHFHTDCFVNNSMWPFAMGVHSFIVGWGIERKIDADTTQGYPVWLALVSDIVSSIFSVLYTYISTLIAMIFRPLVASAFVRSFRRRKSTPPFAKTWSFPVSATWTFERRLTCQKGICTWLSTCQQPNRSDAVCNELYTKLPVSWSDLTVCSWPSESPAPGSSQALYSLQN